MKKVSGVFESDVLRMRMIEYHAISCHCVSAGASPCSSASARAEMIHMGARNQSSPVARTRAMVSSNIASLGVQFCSLMSTQPEGA